MNPKKALSSKLRKIAEAKENQQYYAAEYAELRTQVIGIMKELGIGNLTIQHGESEVSASFFESTQITYDPEKLREKLGWETFKQLVDRVVYIDEQDLLTYARTHPDLKAKLKIRYTPNPKKIEDAFNNRTITLKQLKGTFTAKTTDNLRVTVK